eukprot:COSAG02_NODE_9_length_59728_cov_36.104714_41_plen_38_part_00
MVAVAVVVEVRPGADPEVTLVEIINLGGGGPLERTRW